MMPAVALRRLIPPSAGNSSVTVQQLLSSLEPQRSRTPLARPHLMLNMVSSADGRANIDGRSGPLGGEADRELLHGLRTVADALLVGAGTIRAEHYARILRGESERAARVTRGLATEPLTCIVSETLALRPEVVPLLNEPHARIVILTSSENTLPPTPASVEYVRAARDGRLDLTSALRQLHERFGVRTALCEGGPKLAAELLREGLIDELFLCLAPKLAGGEAALRILAGVDFDPMVPLQLLSLHEHDSYLFMRYAVGGGFGEGG